MSAQHRSGPSTCEPRPITPQASERKEDGIVEVGASGEADVLEESVVAEEAAQSAAPVFRAYRPLKCRYGRQHPEAIVESTAMACVEPPDARYTPALPASLLKGERGFATRGWEKHGEGALSAAQLEAIVYAGQRHERRNADGTRAGFFIGDGTGVGKGREIAGAILDAMCRGRGRAVWCALPPRRSCCTETRSCPLHTSMYCTTVC